MSVSVLFISVGYDYYVFRQSFHSYAIHHTRVDNQYCGNRSTNTKAYH
jgi:hypothetical protein